MDMIDVKSMGNECSKKLINSRDNATRAAVVLVLDTLPLVEDDIDCQMGVNATKCGGVDFASDRTHKPNAKNHEYVNQGNFAFTCQNFVNRKAAKNGIQHKRDVF